MAEDVSGSSPFAGMELTLSADQVKSVSMRPLEPLGGTLPPSGPPTAYEVRRDALMAAATVVSSGGWTDTSARTIEFARNFEKFLKEAR